jgi:hypothetical protein
MLALGIFIQANPKADPDVLVYNSRADQYRQRTYARPEGLPGGELQEGSAADKYKEACDLYLKSDLHKKDDLKRFYTKRWEVFTAARKGTLDLNESPVAVGPACTRLGITADMLDDSLPGQVSPDGVEGHQDQLTLRAIDEALCAQLQHLGPIVDLLAEGSRRRDAQSPLFLFDPWRVDASGEQKDSAVWIFMAEAVMLKARIQWLHGEREQSLESSFAVCRMSRDLSHGAGVVATGRALGVDLVAWHHITQRLMSPDLDLSTARRALDHALYLQKSPFSSEDAFQAKYLTSAPALFPEDAASNAPYGSAPGMKRSVSPPSWLARPAVQPYHESWSLMIAALDRPFVERQVVRQEIAARNKASMNPFAGVVQISFESNQKYDAEIEMSNLRAQMLVLLAAVRIHQLSHQAQPDNLETLETIMGVKAKEDPLVGGKPEVRLNKKGHLVLRYPALDRLKELEIPQDSFTGMELTVPLLTGKPASPLDQPASPPSEVTP